MGCIYPPYHNIVRKLSAGKNRLWKFWGCWFWSKMTIFFDSFKLCPKCHIWMFYRFWMLFWSQMANFQSYITFPDNSGQFFQNRKNLIFWWFYEIWHNLPIFIVAGSGRGYQSWPETCSRESLDAFSYLYRWHISIRSKDIAFWKFWIFNVFDDFDEIGQNHEKSSKQWKSKIFKGLYLLI